MRKLGVFVSSSGVRSIWLRQDLANFKTRLKALETIVVEDGGILTEAHVQALEKKRLDGRIETAHSGYLGSQDTFNIGTLKGVGRVYQQTYIDTYCKVAQVNGMRERFHKTILQEFYQVTVRKKLYQSIDVLQADLDERLHH